MSHTYAILELSEAAFEEIRAKLDAAGYQHAFHYNEAGLALDMHGIAVQAPKHELEDYHCTVCNAELTQEILWHCACPGETISAKDYADGRYPPPSWVES